MIDANEFISTQQMLGLHIAIVYLCTLLSKLAVRKMIKKKEKKKAGYRIRYVHKGFFILYF